MEKPTPDELERRYEEYREKAIASFPFTRVETTGDQALAKWQAIVNSRRGAPVVVGGDDDLQRIVEMMPDVPGFTHKSTEQVLEIASRIRHPDDLISQRAKDMAEARARLPPLLQPKPDVAKPDAALPDFIQAAFPGTWSSPSREDLIAEIMREHQPELGEWPSLAPDSAGLSVVVDLRTGAPVPRAHLVIVPTDDWTTIPAYLRWGNWNGCPAPEYHVAALRSWRDRFGAELVGLSHDVMNIRVRQRPDTVAEALDLAREHYAYCSDSVDQGTGTLSALAAALRENDWWFFWWD
jgi:hypothetical protein